MKPSPHSSKKTLFETLGVDGPFAQDAYASNPLELALQDLGSVCTSRHVLEFQQNYLLADLRYSRKTYESLGHQSSVHIEDPHTRLLCFHAFRPLSSDQTLRNGIIAAVALGGKNSQ
mmetsp:Transcript_23357/g.35400  ORF Transcript_23357/g.35400 Transcript_23357/m.35400 type:complete len:117 (+) Transcript_23357:1215-1565(+)